MTKPEEKIEDLGNNLKIIQNTKGYCFTSDAFLLANFVKAKSSDICVEIGTGSGVIATLVQNKSNCKKILAFEIQSRLATMAQRSIVLNNMQDKIEIVNDRVQNFLKYLKHESVDVVFTNPPYRKRESSIPSEDKEQAICKHEQEITLEELCKISSAMLKFGGKFYIVYDATRTAELIYQLKINKLEPKKMFFTYPSMDKNSVLVLIECKKGAKEGITILPIKIN